MASIGILAVNDPCTPEQGSY